MSILALVLVLAACGTTEPTKVDQSKFPVETSNKDKGIDGGILNYGLVSAGALPGIYNSVFYGSAPDFHVIDIVQPSLFKFDENFYFDDRGSGRLEPAEDFKSVEITINEKLNWHDGKPVTAEDLAFAYEVIAHKDYDGMRYTGLTKTIVGIEDYHNGASDKIAGIEIISPKKLKISYTKGSVQVRNNVWSYPMAKHIFKDIPVKDMPASEHVRTNIVGYGAFKISKVVPGESVTFVRNDDYYAGKPKLAGIQLKAVTASSVLEALKSGDIDYAADFPSASYDETTMPQNVEVLGRMDAAYSYLGFKQGKWDNTTGKNVVDPNAKMGDVKLRQAMLYAMDNKTIAESLYKGLRVEANSIIIPSFKEYHNKSLTGYTYDPEKAKQLLDDAGYKDTNGDSFRETPKGEPLVVNYATMSGTSSAEAQSAAYMKNWADIGLKVELVDGKLHEFNAFYDMVQKDSPKIDIYEAAWATGIDPTPTNLWSETTVSNYTRYTTPEGIAIMENITSDKALEDGYRKEQYNKWQQYFFDEAIAGPTLYRYKVFPVNKRVKNFNIGFGTSSDWSKIELSSDKPITQ